MGAVAVMSSYVMVMSARSRYVVMLVLIVDVQHLDQMQVLGVQK